MTPARKRGVVGEVDVVLERTILLLQAGAGVVQGEALAELYLGLVAILVLHQLGLIAPAERPASAWLPVFPGNAAPSGDETPLIHSSDEFDVKLASPVILPIAGQVALTFVGADVARSFHAHALPALTAVVNVVLASSVSVPVLQLTGTIRGGHPNQILLAIDCLLDENGECASHLRISDSEQACPHDRNRPDGTHRVNRQVATTLRGAGQMVQLL